MPRATSLPILMPASPESSLGFHHVFEPGAKDAPILLVLQGAGGHEYDLLPLARTLAPAAGILSPRGKILGNATPQHIRGLGQGFSDHAGLASGTTELNEFVLAAAAKYSFDLRRLIGLGFSVGANTLVSLLLRQPHTLAGALLLRAIAPFTPISPRPLRNKPILLLAGISDPIVSASETESLETLLNKAKADVEVRWVDAGHALSAEDVEVARRWLQQFYR
jgi:phospholipase/carboxylesterase